MPRAPKKIALDAEVVTVPLNKLHLSACNVRKTATDQEIEALAASIATRGLLHNLTVAAQADEEGKPTGLWEVVAGGRRFRALSLLAERKRLSATAPVPCRTVGGAAALETSLAENEDRQALHPADAYEAFAALHQGGKGLGMEEIAARFSVSVHQVRQRLRLGTVAPGILAAYRAGTLDLDQVMAFTVTEDQEAQVRAFEELAAWQRTAAGIRRVLTQHNIPATDPRAVLVGLDAYQAAGGRVVRDLFSEDGGGWLTDGALLERLAGEQVQQAAREVRAEGWKWIVTDLGEARIIYARARRVWPEGMPLSEADEALRDALVDDLEEIEARYPGGIEDAAAGTEAQADAVRWLAIEGQLQELELREKTYRPEDKARAGAFVTLRDDGRIEVERGFVRPEDELRPEGEKSAGDAQGEDAEDDGAPQEPTATAERSDPAEGSTALSYELAAELCSHRTGALRLAVMQAPDVALRVLAYSLATAAFYIGHELGVFRAGQTYGGFVGTIHDATVRERITALEDAQQVRLPKRHADLWAWLQEQDTGGLLDLVAVCVGRAVDAGAADWTSGAPVHAQVAQAAGLDMRDHWTATRASYLGRVTKGSILAAVREGAGEGAARRIEGMRKDAMAEAAEGLLAGKGWLPARLRVPGTASLAAPVGTEEARPAIAAE